MRVHLILSSPLLFYVVIGLVVACTCPENTRHLPVPLKILSDAEDSCPKIIDSNHGSLLVRNIYYQSLLFSVCHQRSCIVRNITNWNVTSSEKDLEDL